MVPFPFTEISLAPKPVKLNSRTPFSGTSESWNHPSSFVVVPLLVPFNRTLTPTSGFLLLSVTLPETVRGGDFASSTSGRQIETKRKQAICLRTLPRMAVGSSNSGVCNISQALVLQNDLASHCRIIKRVSIENLFNKFQHADDPLNKEEVS